MNRNYESNNTEYAFDSFYELDFSDDFPPGVEYINTLDDITLFADATVKRAEELGWNESQGNLIDFLTSLCKTAGVHLSRQNHKRH